VDVETQALTCMEVWGGNHATFSAFQKAGVDVWLYSQPCRSDVNGGDVYYLSSCASGRITRMLLADVAGHGESVSHVAAGLRDLMRKHVNTIRTKKLINELNAEFAELPAGDRFATSIVSSYFIPTSKLSVCSAGHPMPLVREANVDSWRPIPLVESEDRYQDLPLGVMEASKYNQVDIPLRPGDMVLCFTDGVTESTAANGQLLGINGLVDFLNSQPDDQPESILRELVREVGHGDRSCGDDVTILLLRINDRAPSFRDNLAAPIRWFKERIRKS
jgi:sigma-B regulation protein RsbU (phosphoserine phosphatase)